MENHLRFARLDRVVVRGRLDRGEMRPSHKSPVATGQWAEKVEEAEGAELGWASFAGLKGPDRCLPKDFIVFPPAWGKEVARERDISTNFFPQYIGRIARNLSCDAPWNRFFVRCPPQFQGMVVYLWRTAH